MSQPLFKITSSFFECVSTLNQLDESILLPILNRLLDHLSANQSTNQSNQQPAFKQTEINALHARLMQQSINFSINQLNNLLSFLTYVFETAAYHSLNQSKFHHHLTQSINQISDQAVQSNIDLIVQCYAEKRDAVLSSLMNQSMGPSIMTDLAWRLHVPIYQSINQSEQSINQTNKVTIPTIQQAAEQVNVLFKIATTPSTSQSSPASNNLFMSLNHQQLQQMYENLELVQKQLDSLTERR